MSSLANTAVRAVERPGLGEWILSAAGSGRVGYCRGPDGTLLSGGQGAETAGGESSGETSGAVSSAAPNRVVDTAISPFAKSGGEYAARFQPAYQGAKRMPTSESSIWMNCLWVALGGALGAVLRYTMSLLGKRWLPGDFPWATLAANALGCLLIGILIGFALQKNQVTLYLFLGIGVLGALTTFSTFSAETLLLVSESKWTAAGFNIGVTMVLTLAACWAGLCLGRWWHG